MAVRRKPMCEEERWLKLASGKDKSVRGYCIISQGRKVLVENVNMISRHQKPRGMNQPGGIIR